MSNAIRIKLTKAPEEHDYFVSKFFGPPAIPKEWEADFAEHIVFLGQLRLDEVAPYDTDNRLPKTGYLYFFLDTELYPYDVWVRYYDGEPDLVVEDFNAYDHVFGHLTSSYLMSFEPCDEYESCTRLFGFPANGYDEDDAPLLLQYDPLDNEMDFLKEVDGYCYIFSDTDIESLNTATSFVVDRS